MNKYIIDISPIELLKHNRQKMKQHQELVASYEKVDKTYQEYFINNISNNYRKLHHIPMKRKMKRK